MRYNRNLEKNKTKLFLNPINTYFIFLHNFDDLFDRSFKWQSLLLQPSFIEKSHQIGKKLDHLVARMSHQSFRQQEMVKIRRQWLTSDPSVSNQLQSVHLRQKRQRITSRKRKLTKTETLKKVKMEKRKETMTKLSSDGSINQP